ncbi:MAG: hypothetical protein LIO40_06150 [Ruminococcus sp.]|nr:hypothetical protein [Ruminococcus sp.]
MIDVGAELSEKILKLFAERCSGHKGICSLLDRIEKGKADFADVEAYGRAIGEQLAAAIAEAVTLEALPNGQMYYNIAEKILTPALKNNYELINAAAAKVQEALDEKARLRLHAQKADFPESRVSSIIGSLTDASASNEVILRRLQTPVQTVTESFWDDYVKENAKFRSDSGLRCYIVRRASANCCRWCAALAGRYLYGEEPKDVYRRHDNCTCTVTYENGRTRQNVWTKKSWESPETDTERHEPKRISYPQAKTLEAENMRYKGIGEAAEEEIKRDSEIAEAVQNKSVTLTLNPEKQNIHIYGSTSYDPSKNKSYFKASIEELQKLIDKYYGTGQVTVKEDGEILEYINITEIQGYVVTKEGEYLGETNRFKVHYSKKRTHIVPTED